jgi:hypothetical protein
MLPLETKQSRGKLLPCLDLKGGLLLQEIPHKVSFGKKDYKQKQKEQQTYKTGTV